MTRSPTAAVREQAAQLCSAREWFPTGMKVLETFHAVLANINGTIVTACGLKLPDADPAFIVTRDDKDFHAHPSPAVQCGECRRRVYYVKQEEMS